MKIYQVAKCPFAHRARIVLEEKEIEYEIAYFEPKSRPAEIAAVSPDARSPTIFDDANDTWVWDSLVVIEYLEERYPGVALMPKDAGARARARLVMREVDAKLLPTLGPIVEELVHKSPETRDEAKVQQAIPRFHDALLPWQARLESQSFVLGTDFSLADITLYTPLFAITQLLGIERAIPSTLGGLLAWHERLAARPSTAY